MQVRFFHRVASVLVAITLFAGAQEPLKPKLTPRIVTATRQVTMFSDLEIQMLKAVQKKDKAAIEAMLTDDCVIGMPNADPMPGDEWVDSVMAKDFTLKSFAMRDVFAVDLGNAAVVKFERRQDAINKGKAESGQFFVVDVWKKDGDAWKLANRFVSKTNSEPSIEKPPIKPTGKQ
ncbi:MAG TPA: nuclear transport factor 2 family protein [Alphaproteobacteria bacterium]|nr:nuclear transport factor 2 family protein [Alphaproteobacteria bacterium]